MRTHRSAFTLVELLVVVVILGILAAMVAPRFSTATSDARSSATQSTLAGVRSAIATFRMNAVIQGDDPFPSLTQLTDGTVIKFELPANPYSGVSGVQAVSENQALLRSVVSESSAGWNYFVDNNDNPPVAIFYANSDEASAEQSDSGGLKGANEL
ncbi:MAG: prepilin-type N-terminal cleavage/methylation domain-containing protein [Phycisphaerales bacterium]